MKLLDILTADCRELMELVKTESRRMIDAQPSESAIGNMARRGSALSYPFQSNMFCFLMTIWQNTCFTSCLDNYAISFAWSIGI